MILKVMFSGVILNVLSDFDKFKSLCNVYFFEILAILRPKLVENHHFGVTYFLTLHIEA